jgi:hypothetical protein
MALSALPVDKLRQYLRELPSGARTLLIAELERAVLRGDEIPGGDMLLQEVRAAVRESGERMPRIGNPARLFFRPIEPFLTDVAADRKTPGRIPRAALELVWTWISRDLAPVECKAYCDEVDRAIAAGDMEPSASLALSLHEVSAQRMHAALAGAETDEKLRRRMSTQLAMPNAPDHIRDIATILSCRDALELIESRLPGHIRNLGEGTLDNVKSLLDSPICAEQKLRPYALILVMNRLAVPWQLIRLAVKAAESDAAARIAASPYALAVTITLGEIERMVGDLGSDLKRGAAVAVTSLLKCIHDAVRGVRTELDLSADSPWGRQLSAIRSEISNVLKAEIESVPGRVRRLLRPRPSNEIARGSVLDADEVAETEAMIEFVSACRNYASELAISEMTLRTFQDIQQFLDTGTRSLLDGLRMAGEPDRPFRKSQVDAAIRFCSRAFGKDYASLLVKAAEMAGNAERKAARA